MVLPSHQPGTAELVKELLERLAITSSREQQAEALNSLATNHSQTRGDLEVMKSTQQKFTAQQALLQDQHDKLCYKLEDIKKQISTIGEMTLEITALKNEKEELRAIVSTVQDEVKRLRLQVAAQDGLRMLQPDFLQNAVPSPEGLAQQQNQLGDHDEDVDTSDPVTAAESHVRSANPDLDVSMTLTSDSRFTFEVPVNGTRRLVTPELTMLPPTFSTPCNAFSKIMMTPGTVGTMMPDTPGMGRYNGPAQLSLKPLLVEQSGTADENRDTRAKRARRHSIMPHESSILSPITENINEKNELEPVTGLDKELWREAWEQSDSLETLENFARQQKIAILRGDLVEGNTTRVRKRLTPLEQLEVRAPLVQRKRARHQSKSEQLLAPRLANSTALRSISAQPRRTARTSAVPSRFSSHDILMGEDFLAATTSRRAASSKAKPSQPRAHTLDAPQKNVHFDDDEEDEPQTPGTAASSLLQQFGVRKSKLPSVIEK